MTKYRTLAELGEFIDYEGGLESALRYGVYPEDVPEEIQADWKRLEYAWDEYRRIADELSSRIDKAYQEAVRNGELDVY